MVNLWIYSSHKEQSATAASLITFGAEVFYRAKIIKDIEILKATHFEIDKRTIHPSETNISDFIFEHLVDCIRILIFFENYMKAELIIKDFCVHSVDKNWNGFAELGKEQNSRPIKIEEINRIEEFVIDESKQTIYHNAIKETTIGLNVLLSSHYQSFYNLDLEMIKFIRWLNKLRNRLHFSSSAEFQISNRIILDYEKAIAFVDEIIKTRITSANL